ncbi:MAG: hypothetical protein V8R80_05950 [Eubacterium sp.]
MDKLGPAQAVLFIVLAASSGAWVIELLGFVRNRKNRLVCAEADRNAGRNWRSNSVSVGEKIGAHRRI